MNGDYETCQADVVENSATMGLLKTHANFVTNLLAMPSTGKSHSDCCPCDDHVCELRWQQMLEEKIAARERFQANLERRARRLMRRLCKLQVTESSQHISRELHELVNCQHWALHISPSGGKVDSHVVPKTVLPSFGWNNGGDQGLSVTHTADMTKSATTAVVNLLQKLESSHNSNLTVKQRAAIVDYVRRHGPQLPQDSGVVVVPGSATVDKGIREKLDSTCGSLLTNLSFLEHEVDSDATASSSGGESCDEMEGYDDRKTKATTIQRRAFWKWAVDRAAVVSRWTWLQAQVSDLEYRIRQTSEIHRQIRKMKDPTFSSKGQVSPAPQVNGLLTNQDGAVESSSCRTSPLKPIRKRKLLCMFGLHHISRKAARLSTIRCSCVQPALQCAICTGRATNVKASHIDAMPINERVALLDPSFHPVLSFPRDISLAIHFEALVKSGEYGKLPVKQRSVTTVKKKARTLQISDHARKHSRKLKKNATVTLTTKMRKKISTEKRLSHRHVVDTESRHCHLRKRSKQISVSLSGHARERSFSESSGCSSKPESPVPSPEIGDNSSSQASGNSSWGSADPREHRRGSVLQEMLRRRRGESAFDINNIVIPYSMAAATRVERLQYKEILTPKWRVMEEGDSDNPHFWGPSDDEEDVSDEAILRRHDRCEVTEKKRFMSFMKAQGSTSRRVRSMRSDSRADSSGANTPDPLSPHVTEHQDSPLVTPPSTPAPYVGEEQQPLAVHQRRRTTSLSKRDRMFEDIRVATPPELLYEYEPVPPWEHRAFPLGDLVYDEMVQESTSSENDLLPACQIRECDWNDSNPKARTDDDSSLPSIPCDLSDWTPVSVNPGIESDFSQNGLITN